MKDYKKPPTIRIEVKNNRFILSTQLSKKLDLRNGNGVMFKINYNQKKAYIYKDNDPESYIVGQNNRVFRFNSKEMIFVFHRMHGILSKDKFYFNAFETENKGVFSLEFVEK